MLKKLAVAAAALMIAAPAFADHRHRDHRKPHYVVHQRPVVVHRHHRPAPRPVHVVHHYNQVNPIAVLAGAVIGAAIVHHAITGY